MSAFLGSFIQYVIIMICLVAVGLCGGYVGVKLRKNKEAKTQQEASSNED